jgi:drug/metabolite transporter (DMT)-like permease
VTSISKGAALGITSAFLFGLSAPLAKLLLLGSGPLFLAALLYLGGGLGLTAFGGMVRRSEASLHFKDAPLMAVIVLCGGIAGPLLMLFGLFRLSGLTTSLLLNLEGPLTLLLAVSLFGEHLGRRSGLGAGLVFAGAILLGIQPGALRADWLGTASVVTACLAWAVDNNLTQRLSLKDPVAIVRLKALIAGSCILLVALARGQPVPAMSILIGALVLGAASYGLSVVLDVYALREVGAAREAAYFATAPFIGALASIPILGDRLNPLYALAGAIMALGVFELVRERHSHLHTHEAMAHEHLHVHDDHHQHGHELPLTEPHSHWHAHVPLTHDHAHVSDAHHRHRHR